MKEEIIKILSNKETATLTAMQLLDLLDLNLDEDYHKLIDVLNKLCEDGILYHSNKDKYLLFENSHLVKGKLQLKEKGFGFILDTGLEKDIFVKKNDINNAYDGDIVAVEITDKYKNEGKIVKVLKRSETSVIGEVQIYKNKCYVYPDKKNIPILEIKNNHEIGAVDGHKVVVRRKNGNYGIITDIIGHKNDPNIDMLSILYRYGFIPEFNKEVLKEIESIPTEVSEEETKERLDLRDEVIFTMDDADTKDMDDAISIKKNEDGTYELGVHIAHVSYYVKKDTAIDNDASGRGTSGYFIRSAVNMLHPKLSNGICSLNPEVDRLTRSCIMTIDNQGKVISYKLERGVIRSRKKMTYEAVNKILEENELVEGYEQYIDKLKISQELSEILSNKMINRGYIDFDTREVKIIVDENNHPIDMELREQRTAEKIIENFMIVTNETVAEHIFYMGLPGIYRVHDKPVDKKVDMFFDFLKSKGLSVTGKRHGKITVKDFQNILSQLSEEEGSMVFKDLLVRSMAKAIYSDENIGHFGLGSKCYTHFTSPIRRYPDLIVHRLLDTYSSPYNKEEVEYWEENLSKIAEHCSTRERDADNCEYEVEDMKMAEYMQDHIGEVYEGVISGVQSFGIFVTILENGVEGLIKVEDLGYDNYVFHDKEISLVGTNTKQKYTLGDKIKIEVLRANKEARTIDFKLEGDIKCQKTKNTKVKRKEKK